MISLLRNLVFSFLLLPLQPLLSLPGFYEPWGKDSDVHMPSEAPQRYTHRSMLIKGAEAVIAFHQNVLSPVDGPRSHFRPSSSGYMREAMQKYGFIQGYLRGCDRLLRENSDPWIYRTIEYEGTLFKWDPP